MIPIQITNNTVGELTNRGGQINVRPGEACNGFNGNLNSWYFGLNPEFREKLLESFKNVGMLARIDMMNSPYYNQVEVDKEYIKFLQKISNCNNNFTQNLKH